MYVQKTTALVKNVKPYFKQYALFDDLNIKDF